MNKRLILFTLAVSLYQLTFLPLYAVKAYPHPFTVTQPDGTQLTIHLQGDEFHHYKTSEDGYLLKQNAKGFLTYASTNKLGEIVESKFIARNITKRSETEAQFLKTVNQSAQLQKIQSAPMKANMLRAQSQPNKVFPVTGSPHSLVILVNFKDTSFVTPAPEVAFSNLLNQEGYSANGGTGSARDYFMASSYGKFAPTFDVVGTVTLPNNMAFYGANGANGSDVNAVQMVVDACTLANAAGLDFSKYDVDNDGIIDNVFIYYAGYNAAEQGPDNSIWPHRGGVYPSDLYPDDYNYSGTAASVTFNGKQLVGYACTSELQGNTGSNMCGVGTFCHEFGHVLGLPDYYNQVYSSSHTLDSWDIMDAGNYNNNGRTPPTYSVFDRFFLGYLTPEQVSTGSNLTLLPIYQGTSQLASTTNQAFLFSATTHNLSGVSPSPNEYFMVEYRKQTGWDTYLPAEGMCIWHVDYNQAAWNNNTVNSYTGATQTAASHMRLYLQPLSGSTTAPGTAFTAGSFIPTTWSNIDINRAIKNITKTAENIKFDFMPPKMFASANFTSFSTNFGTPSVSQSINISALNLTSNLNIVFQNSGNFDMKLSTDNTWSKSLGLVPTSGSVSGTVEVRYNPKSTGTQTDLINISTNGLNPLNFSLTGTAGIGPDSPVIFAGTVDDSLLFFPTKLYTANTKTINIKTSDIVSDLSLAITGTNASLFTVSVSSIAKDIANGIAGNNITINYIPAMIGTHSAVLTVSGGGLPDRVVSLSGSGY
jgi:M6 family metalloprotease-like protein